MLRGVLEVPEVTVRGTKIFYETGQNQGNGPTVIFVHGAGASSRRWRNQLQGLGAVCYPVALDLPGHGASGGQPCSEVALYREWVKDFAESLGIDKFVLAGHSMGGAIALDFAVTYMNQLQALILVATGARLKVDPQRLESLRRGNLEYNEVWVRMSYSPSAPPWLVDEALKEMLAVDPVVYYHDLCACNRFDVMKKIDEICVPTLVICGEDDQITPLKYAQYLADHISGAKLAIIPDAGHAVMLEQPAEVNSAIESFLRQL